MLDARLDDALGPSRRPEVRGVIGDREASVRLLLDEDILIDVSLPR